MNLLRRASDSNLFANYTPLVRPDLVRLSGPLPTGHGLIEVGGISLEAIHVPAAAGAPTLVFLHEGLGSVAMWRDFPRSLASAAGLGWLAYSRQGHGRSDPLFGPRSPEYLDYEALEVLPEVLDRCAIARPILYGHSDGATIALIHAAEAAKPVEAVVVEAPHVCVEAVTLAGIRVAGERARNTGLLRQLGRYHEHAAPMFEAWHSVWLSSAFRDWTITHRLPAITAPILALQGGDDPYGSVAQITTIAAAASGPVATLILDGIGHNPHDEFRAQVIDAVLRFTGWPRDLRGQAGVIRACARTNLRER
jgi:pimeloyl-ACP methyl ester carboxylesterase